MNTKQILSTVPSTYLETPVTVTVQVSPATSWQARLQKRGWMSKTRSFEIRPINLGSLVKISEILLTIEDNLFDSSNALTTTYAAIKKHHRDVATIIAIAIVNRKTDPPVNLIDFIEHNFSATDLMKCMDVVLQQMNISNFMKSIISVRGMNLIKMSPAEQRS